MTQAQRSLYNLLIRTNKISKDAGEPYFAMPKTAFTEIAEAVDDDVARHIVDESKRGKLAQLQEATDEEPETVVIDPAAKTTGEEVQAAIYSEAGQIEVLLWFIYMQTSAAGTLEGVKKTLEQWVKLQELLGDIIDPAVEVKDPGRRSRTAKNYLLPTGKVIGVLPRLIVGGQAAQVEVIHKNKKTPAVRTIVQLSADMNGVQIAGNIDAFDLAVLDGVTSLLYCGNDFITADMAHRATTGDRSSKSITKDQRKDVTDSIEKLLQVWATVDATGEAKAYNKGVEYFELRDHLLSAVRVKAKVNGTTVEGYKFDYEKNGRIKMPILFKYASISGQIATVPIELLDLPINNTKTNIVLRDYLLKRIGAMKNKSATIGNKIAFATVYEVCGISAKGPSFKTEAKRARDATMKMLEEWKKRGHINGYKQYNDGRTIAGVVISI